MRYEFEHCVVDVNEEWKFLQTTFHDGTFVTATPNHDEASIAMAISLGYGTDTWAMSRDHELAHSYLSNGRSPTLWRLAHPESLDNISDEQVGYEEDAVLSWQRYRIKTNQQFPWIKENDNGTEDDHN